MDDDSDEAIVRRFQAGDADAFLILWDRFHLRVYRYCHRRLGDREMAQDAAQDAFTKALAALPGLVPIAFGSWLFSIAHNVTADQLRRRRPTASLDDAEELHDETPYPGAMPSTPACADDLAAVLNALSTQQREVVTLFLSDYSISEIAMIIGKSYDATDMTFRRALVRIRALLGLELAQAKGEGDDA